MTNPSRRWSLIITFSFIGLLIAGFAAFQLGIHALKGQIEKALGPHGEVKEIRVGLTGVEIIGIRIKAPQEANTWPAADQLRAERILIVPSFIDLLLANVSLQTLRVEGAYISMLRTKDGRVKVLPGLLDKPAADASNKKGGSADPETSTPISIGKIELIDGTIEFFDATVRQPAHKLRLEQINAGIGKVHLPDLKGFTSINLVGVLKGVKQDGKITMTGNIELASRESGITTRLRDIDLIALQPYLLKAAETGVRSGSLDLDLTSSVRKGMLHAPGTLTLSNVELASTSGTLMGMPRSAVVGMMKNRDGKISVKFVLDGNINDPRFSLNENLATRIGASMANSLGVSIEGLAKGIGSVGSGTTKGLGDTLGKLIKK